MWDNLLWIFICIGVAGGIWSAIYHSIRPQKRRGRQAQQNRADNVTLDVDGDANITADEFKAACGKGLVKNIQ